MAATYTISLTPTLGLPISTDITGHLIDALDVTLAEMDVGVAHLSTSARRLYDVCTRDALVSIYREPASGVRHLVGKAPFLVRRRKETYSRTGYLLEVWAEHANTLLNRRIVAYPTGSAQAVQVGFACDVMKQVVRENLGVLAVSGRNISASLSIPANNGAGAAIEVGASNELILSTLQGMAQTSFENGVYASFGLESTSGGNLLFRSEQFCLGRDRRAGRSVAPVVFGEIYGNVSEVVLDENWIGEKTYIYVGGSGEGADRLIREVSDSTLIAASVWGRNEEWADARTDGGVSTQRLDFIGQQRLRETRGVPRFEAVYLPSGGTEFGIDFDWADLVSGYARGIFFDCHVSTVGLTVTSQAETIDIRLVGEAAV